jgi:hypothetical protein
MYEVIQATFDSSTARLRHLTSLARLRPSLIRGLKELFGSVDPVNVRGRRAQVLIAMVAMTAASVCTVASAAPAAPQTYQTAMNAVCKRGSTLASSYESRAQQALKTHDYKSYWLALGGLVGTTDGTFQTIRHTPIPATLRPAMLPAGPLLDQVHAYTLKFENDTGASDGPSALNDVKAMAAIAKKLAPHFIAAGLNVCAS